MKPIWYGSQLRFWSLSLVICDSVAVLGTTDGRQMSVIKNGRLLYLESRRHVVRGVALQKRSIATATQVRTFWMRTTLSSLKAMEHGGLSMRGRATFQENEYAWQDTLHTKFNLYALTWYLNILGIKPCSFTNLYSSKLTRFINPSLPHGEHKGTHPPPRAGSTASHRLTFTQSSILPECRRSH